MLDYYSLQSKTGNPTLTTVIYTIILAFLLSTLIAVTYLKTFRGRTYSRNFVQSIILCSMISATIIQAIGDSVAIGLGVLGALSIIRFRINLKNPRNIIFIFASLAIGIAVGVYGYIIAIAGTVSFCIVSVVLYHSPLGQTIYYDSTLRIDAKIPFDHKEILDPILTQYCEEFTMNQVTHSAKLDGISRYEYNLRYRKNHLSEGLVNELKKISAITEIKMAYSDNDASI